jgi:hypothetical protein
VGEQLALDGVVTRLLYRRDDPETSRAAAVRVAAHLTESQERALAIVALYGPGTLRQIAERHAEEIGDLDVSRIYHELARRCAELARGGLVDYQRDDRGLAVRVDGCRVWEAVQP